jgi:hypothetical protein
MLPRLMRREGGKGDLSISPAEFKFHSIIIL